MTIYHQYNLKKYNSWRLDSYAKEVIIPNDYNELSLWVRKNQTLGLWLGLGSNVLLPKIVNQPVVLTQKSFKKFASMSNHRIYAQCGVTCAQLSKLCCQQGYEDAAFLAGIPGTIGGALAMNAGAFEGETWNAVIAVDVIDQYGHIYHLAKEKFNASYRQLTTTFDIRFLAVYFQFTPGSSEKANQYLKQCIHNRNQTQPIGTFNCGSVFKNPYPQYAAKLIEKNQFKGVKINDAIVSDIHANFILNQGQATYEDMIKLIRNIQEKVHQQDHILLDTEVVIVE